MTPDTMKYQLAILFGNRLELVYANSLIHGEWLYQPDRNSYGSSHLTVGPRIV